MSDATLAAPAASSSSSGSSAPAAVPPAVNLNVVPSADGSSIAVSVTVDGATYAGILLLATPPATVGAYLYSGQSVTPQPSGG